ncbi:transient receptor potential channel-like [Saccoglossus kowalevskii]
MKGNNENSGTENQQPSTSNQDDEVFRKTDNKKTRMKNYIKRHQFKQKIDEDTTSYGEIQFKSNGPKEETSPYVRVNGETEPEHLYKLLVNIWGVHEPRALISMVGSNKDPDSKESSLNLFKGIFEAAISSKAWLITDGTVETDGTEVGVSKMVGDAVEWLRDFHQQKVVLLGISPWKIIKNNKLLEKQKDTKCFLTAMSVPLLRKSQ